jgi:hypothetical protein
MAGDFAFLLDNCVNIFAGTAWNPPRKACLSATLSKNKNMLLCSMFLFFASFVARVLESGVRFHVVPR